ncbi:MAG: hypothetical protein E7378_00070 [Clostridiales bacterium]|nr:hypothetical protein [Clostridiales bacterium]
MVKRKLLFGDKKSYQVGNPTEPMSQGLLKVLPSNYLISSLLLIIALKEDFIHILQKGLLWKTRVGKIIK